MDIYQDTTGTLLMKMKKGSSRDIDSISEAMDELREKQLEEGIFSFDGFTSEGSNAFVGVSTSLDDEVKECTVWSINHYLNLNRHPYVIEKAVEATRKFGTGCGTSAISGGMNTLHKNIEQRLSNWYNKDIMLFPTGFTANMGSLAALCQEGDHVLIDSESHASIRDGVKLSPVRRWISFDHNSLQDLEAKLEVSQKECEGKIVVIVESAYSMSGDICPLVEIAALKEKYDFLLFVDEAHSFGLYGESGKGLCHQMGVVDKVDFITSTFSKATASIGGFVACERKYLSYFQWGSNAFAFQACFTPADAGTILAALDVLEREPELMAELHKKNSYMRDKLTEAGFDLGSSESPVIPVYIPDTEKLMKVSFDLYKNNVFSVPIAYPMVGKEEGRIRFIVNRGHTYDHIDHTVGVLRKLADQYDLFTDQDEMRKKAIIGQTAVSGIKDALDAELSKDAENSTPA